MKPAKVQTVLLPMTATVVRDGATEYHRIQGDAHCITIQPDDGPPETKWYWRGRKTTLDKIRGRV